MSRRLKNLLEGHNLLRLVQDVDGGRGKVVRVVGAVYFAVGTGPMAEVKLPATMSVVTDWGGRVSTKG